MSKKNINTDGAVDLVSRKYAKHSFASIRFCMRQRFALYFLHTGCPRMFYTVFQKNIKNIKSTMSLIIILVIECLICALPTVNISFTYLYPLRCDMVSLKIDK